MGVDVVAAGPGAWVRVWGSTRRCFLLQGGCPVPVPRVAMAVPRDTQSLQGTLMCPVWACSSPGARSSTGGSGCTPTRTTGGSSKLETEPPRPCLSPCHRPQLSHWLSACISGVSSWGAGMEVPHPREGSGGVCSQLGRATGPVCQLAARSRAPTGAFPRWSDGSLLNFVSWAPGKPRPINKDKKCVYMTASRGERPGPAVLGLWGGRGSQAEQRHPYPRAVGGSCPACPSPQRTGGTRSA